MTIESFQFNQTILCAQARYLNSLRKETLKTAEVKDINVCYQ